MWYRLLGIAIVALGLLGMPALPTYATVCRDGTVSRSSGRGTCSHHGGVAGGGSSSGGSGGGVSDGATGTNPIFYVPPGHRPLVDYRTYFTWALFNPFWKTNGGLEVFGYAKTPEYLNPDNYMWTQIFERNRLEYHRENPYPYDVQLGLLGEERLLQLGRVWQNEPKADPKPGCRYFAETGHNLCEPFLTYWRKHGIEFDNRRGFSEGESLALFGYPITEATNETGADGVSRPTQWFQRARFEDHGDNGGVLLGLLGNEVYGQ